MSVAVAVAAAAVIMKESPKDSLVVPVYFVHLLKC